MKPYRAHVTGFAAFGHPGDRRLLGSASLVGVYGAFSFCFGMAWPVMYAHAPTSFSTSPYLLLYVPLPPSLRPLTSFSTSPYLLLYFPLGTPTRRGCSRPPCAAPASASPRQAPR